MCSPNYRRHYMTARLSSRSALSASPGPRDRWGRACLHQTSRFVAVKHETPSGPNLSSPSSPQEPPICPRQPILIVQMTTVPDIFIVSEPTTLRPSSSLVLSRANPLMITRRGVLRVVRASSRPPWPMSLLPSQRRFKLLACRRSLGKFGRRQVQFAIRMLAPAWG